MNAPPPATDILPTDIASGDSPMAIRSQGLLPEVPAVTRREDGTPPIDAWALAVRLARAPDRIAMQATCREIRALAGAVLELAAGLVSAGVTDRTTPYAPGESRPDGALPQEGERWRTPREIADHLITWEAPKP